MNPFNLPENEYGNVSCFDFKTKKVFLPEGFVKTTLTMHQLKKLNIPTVKGHVGFDHVMTGGRRGIKRPMPKLINLILIKDEPKAIAYMQKFQAKKHFSEKYGMKNSDWLFE